MLTRWLALALVAACCRFTDACSCAPAHPQTHFCNSDFVIVGRVQKTFRGKNFYDAYKVKIRNKYKTTPKAEVALQSGRLLTPSQDSMCGVTLQPRETYVITGRVVHLEAHVHLCSFISKWRDVTPRQRKGFRLLYKQGCSCKVRMLRRRTKSPNTCVSSYDDCYERHGICLHDREQHCRWTRCLTFQSACDHGLCNQVETSNTYKGSRSHEVPAIDALQQHYDLIHESNDAHLSSNVPSNISSNRPHEKLQNHQQQSLFATNLT